MNEEQKADPFTRRKTLPQLVSMVSLNSAALSSPAFLERGLPSRTAAANRVQKPRMYEEIFPQSVKCFKQCYFLIFVGVYSVSFIIFIHFLFAIYI